jgi:hypothetical protein
MIVTILEMYPNGSAHGITIIPEKVKKIVYFIIIKKINKYLKKNKKNKKIINNVSRISMF